jgi:hypothetical protein
VQSWVVQRTIFLYHENPVQIMMPGQPMERLCGHDPATIQNTII